MSAVIASDTQLERKFNEDQRPTEKDLRIVTNRFQFFAHEWGIYSYYLSDIADKMGLTLRDFHSSTRPSLRPIADKENMYLFTRNPRFGARRQETRTEIPGADIIKLAIEFQSLDAEKAQFNKFIRKNLDPHAHEPEGSSYIAISEDGRNWSFDPSRHAPSVKEELINLGFPEESLQIQRNVVLDGRNKDLLFISREAARNLLKPQESISSAAGDAKGISEASALSDVSGFSKGDSKSSVESAQLPSAESGEPKIESAPLPPVAPGESKAAVESAQMATAVSGESKSEAERQSTLLLALFAEAEQALAKPSMVAPPGGPVVDCDSAASAEIRSKMKPS